MKKAAGLLFFGGDFILKPVQFSVLSASLPSTVSFRWAGFPGIGFGKFQPPSVYPSAAKGIEVDVPSICRFFENFLNFLMKNALTRGIGILATR